MRIDQNKLIHTAELERQAMDEFLNLFLPNTDKHYHKRYFTMNEGNSGYDCLVNRINNNTKKQVKRMIFEVKVRNRHYPTLILEKVKFDKLSRLVTDPITGIYYVNFTPYMTVVFDLLKLKNEGKIEFKEESHNIQTVDKSLGKTIKQIAHLNVSDGKSFNFIFNPTEAAKKNESRS